MFNLSKIQIESNSQQKRDQFAGKINCVQSFKDTNRKQFTTKDTIRKELTLLCSIFQRYKSKAIHNTLWHSQNSDTTVFNLSKIQIESNSQQQWAAEFLNIDCVQSFKDTNRKQFTTQLTVVYYKIQLCSIFQRYKSKAIHNNWIDLPTDCKTVFNLSKIQIESNSQPAGPWKLFHRNCVQSFKDTNRKQFTTTCSQGSAPRPLCSIFQRYKSKAIHNTILRCRKKKRTVFNLSKIQIESNSQHKHFTCHSCINCVQSFKDTNREQFTTCSSMGYFKNSLCSILQRYKSKAIHNGFVHIISVWVTVLNTSKIQIESNSQPIVSL